MNTLESKVYRELPDYVVLAGQQGIDQISEHRIKEMFQHLLFNPAQGRIWLEDRRMVLLQADLLVSLRRELIDAAGIDITRRLLTRLGYLAGANDAAIAKRLCHGSELIDAIATGMQFHSLEGIAVVELVKLEFSTNTKSFYGEFLWRDCAEDIMDTSASPEPTCWMQIGYASGYLSTFTGEQIIAREVECRSMGHPVCRVICRQSKDWQNVTDPASTVGEHPASNQIGVITAPNGFKEPHEKLADHIAGHIMNASSSGNFSEAPAGASAAFNAAMHRITKAAPTQATVFLQGESGVGKSMFARELHRLSGKRTKFVEVNCAALPEQLLEAELFGVERGAYTHATESRPGRFELANGGTIFMDEVALLSPGSQGKLLRVLQTGELERLGSTKTIRVDVRVVAATNDNLKNALKEGRFRADLYYRLNVLPILIPPLRERKDDIPVLIERFLIMYSRKHNHEIAGITSRALRTLLNYDWPGNIRELENVLERGVVLAEPGSLIDIGHLFTLDDSFSTDDLMGLNRLGRVALCESSEIAVAADPGPADEPSSDVIGNLASRIVLDGQLGLFDIEEAVIRAAIQATNGNISGAARMLKISRGQLDHRVKLLGTL